MNNFYFAFSCMFRYQFHPKIIMIKIDDNKYHLNRSAE